MVILLVLRLMLFGWTAGLLAVTAEFKELDEVREVVEVEGAEGFEEL